MGARRRDILSDEAIDRAVRKLNNADVALYPVDARGVTVQSTYSNPNNFTWSAMDEFAKRTGGKTFYSNNGLDFGIGLDIKIGVRLPVAREEFSETQRVARMVGSNQYRIAYGIRDEEHAPQQKGIQEYLPQRSIGLHDLTQIGAVDFEEGAGF